MIVLIKKIDKDMGKVVYPRYVRLTDIYRIQQILKPKQMKMKYWLIWLPPIEKNTDQEMSKSASMRLTKLPKGMSDAVFKKK